MRIFIALFLYWFPLIGMAEPCVLPFHHMIHYTHNPDKPDDIMATYLRVDSTRQVAPTYYEYGGYMRNMTVRGTFAFISRNWASKDGPDGVKTNYHWFSTFAKNYRGGLRSVSLVKPAEPNTVSIFFVSVSAKPDTDAPYHGKWCRYVTENSRPIRPDDIKLYRPCKVCTPDDPETILKNLLPVDVLAEMWIKQE